MSTGTQHRPRGEHVATPPARRTVKLPGATPPSAAASGSARVAGARGKAPLAWLPWVAGGLLLGLLALMLVAFLLARAGSEAPTGASSTGTSSGTSTSSGGAPAPGTGTVAAPAGSLMAGSTDVLASPGRIASLTGAAAAGRSVRVQSVVADEGFWVGTSEASRVFVFLEPAARLSSGESRFQVKAGQTVNLTGTVQPVTADFPGRIGVTADEGSGQLQSQGAFVSARTIRLS